MTELFLSLAALSFKASFLILAVVILRLLLKKAPRRIICSLWLLVGIRLIVPFSIESSLSLMPQPDISVQESTSSLVEAPLPEVPSSPAPAPTPGTNREVIILSPSGTQTLPQSNADSGKLPAPSTPHQSLPDTGQETAQRALPSPVEAAAITWLFGAAVMLIYALLSYLFLRRQLREAVPADKTLRLCAGLDSPFVLGLFRPKIYIPFGIPKSQFRYVLAHERAHIARGDHWTKLIGFLVLALHWFNPLVWLGYVLMCRDMELACDEKVIASMDSHERKAYSLALLSCAVKASPLAACPLAFGEVGVKQRIKSVLSYKKPGLWIIIAALLLGLAAGLFFLTDPKEKEDFVCPEEVLNAMDDHMDTHPLIRRYEILEIKKRSENLYAVFFDARLRRVSDLKLYAEYGLPSDKREISAVYYAYCLDGQWQISPKLTDIPMYGAEESETSSPAPLEDTKGKVSEFPLTDIYPDTPVGIGVNLIYDDENLVIFQAEHGLFAYSLAERRMILAMDTVKAVGIAGFQGSIPVAGVRTSADGQTIQLYHTSHKDLCLYIDTYTGDYQVAPYEKFPDEGDGERVIDRKSFIESYGITVGCFADQYYSTQRGSGERIPLFADFPFATTATAELPIEAHIMDRLRFYLPVGWSTGYYDLFLSGTGNGVAIYDSRGEKVGSMELSFAVKPEFSDGEIVFADDGENHASFTEPFESIGHSLPCAIGRHERDKGEADWFILFASPEQKSFCYVLRLDAHKVDRALAISIAKTLRPTYLAFSEPDQSDMPYWSIIDTYATAIAAGLEPVEFEELGLNPAVAIAAREMGPSASLELCYDIWDLDGDGQKELHINTSCNTDSFYYAMLMALYTIDDSGEAVKVLESSERSRYCFAGGNTLAYYGSSSAFDSICQIYRYENGKLIYSHDVMEEGGFPINIAMPSSGICPFSRVARPYSPLSPSGAYVDISSYTGLSIYTPETGYSYAIESDTYIAQMAAIIGSGGLSSIDESEYMEAAASAPLTLLFESRNAGESVSLLASPVSTYPKLCIETPESCFYYNVSGDGLQPARELISNASMFSVNGSSFYYRVPELGLIEYDMTEYVTNMDIISSARAVKDKLVLECHTGPKNAVYLIFDTLSRSFEKEIIGTNLTWYGDMLASAVYSFWEGVYNYNGELIKEYELKEDEFIRGLEFSENGRSLIVSIEGSGRIRQDIVTILNDATPGLSMSSDLDMDGSDDSISLRGDGGLYIDGRVFLTGLGAADMESLSLYTADIVPEDGFLELAISRGGSDAETLFFRWDGENILYLGSIPAEYGDIEFHEGYCVAEFPCEVLPGWMLYGHWVVKNGELVLTNGMNSGMHYLFTRSSYNQDASGDPVPHRLKSSIVVYDGNEKPTDREVLPAGSTVALMGCDNVEWLRIMSDNGASYWLHIADGKIETPSGAIPIGDVIEGLGRN